jgi:hypothetical protein
MSRDFSDFTISECDDVVEKYGLTDFETYIARDFPRFNENERLAICCNGNPCFPMKWR